MDEKDELKEYIQYLQKYCRNKDVGLWEAHQNSIHREVAREYGLSGEDIQWLDENL